MGEKDRDTQTKICREIQAATQKQTETEREAEADRDRRKMRQRGIPTEIKADRQKYTDGKRKRRERYVKMHGDRGMRRETDRKRWTYRVKQIYRQTKIESQTDRYTYSQTQIDIQRPTESEKQTEANRE